jgi:hypothetical protein
VRFLARGYEIVSEFILMPRRAVVRLVPRLWDCGTPGNSLAEMRLPPDFVEGAPLAAFDSTGLVFGISAAMSGGEGYVSGFFCHDTRHRF